MTSLKQLFDKAQSRSYERSVKRGKVGKHNPDTSVTYSVEGRADYLWVTLSDKTVVQARNEAGVPHTEDYPVKLIVFHGDHIIIGRDTSGTLVVPTPTPPSGVLPHAIEEHSDAVITAAASGDVLAHDGTNWVNSPRATVVAGAINAATSKNPPVDADEFGITDSAAFFALKKLTWANLKATIATYYNTLAATLQNKTLDSTNISTLTAKNPPVDADSVVIVDSAASNFFKRVTYTNIKAFLKTYFDTLYNLYVHPNHTGDVTSVADGVTTIADDAVTFAKMQNIATDSLLGRATASTGDIELITLTAFARTLIDDVDAAAGRATLGAVGLTGDETVAGVKTLSSNPVVSNAAPGAKFTSPNQGISSGTELWRLTVEGDDSSAGFPLSDVLWLRYKGTGTWNDPNTPGMFSVSVLRNLGTFLEDAWGINNYGNMFLGTTDVEQTPATHAAMQLGATGYVFIPRSADGIWWVNNAYNDSGWKRRTAAPATAIEMTGDDIIFHYAATGLIDSGFTWTEMARFKAGDFGVGATPAARHHVLQPTLGSVVQRLTSTATNDDPTEDVVQARVATTNATVTTLATITIPASTTVMLVAYVTARRTGGVSGTAEDSWGYIRSVLQKNVAGVCTTVGNSSGGHDQSWEDQTGFNVQWNNSGANCLLQVTGAAGNNVTWHATIRMYAVSS